MANFHHCQWHGIIAIAIANGIIAIANVASSAYLAFWLLLRLAMEALVYFGLMPN